VKGASEFVKKIIATEQRLKSYVNALNRAIVNSKILRELRSVMRQRVKNGKVENGKVKSVRSVMRQRVKNGKVKSGKVKNVISVNELSVRSVMRRLDRKSVV
jgi:hypothetical protein